MRDSDLRRDIVRSAHSGVVKLTSSLSLTTRSTCRRLHRFYLPITTQRSCVDAPRYFARQLSGCHHALTHLDVMPRCFDTSTSCHDALTHLHVLMQGTAREVRKASCPKYAPAKPPYAPTHMD